MSSYFDEHDCNLWLMGPPLDELLHFARFLVTSGNWNHEEFSAFFADKPPPPTSKQFMEELPTRVIRDDLDKECPICLKKFEQDDELTLLPCDHEFHNECVTAWLNKAANCPLCRKSFPTDDPEWEEMQKQKKRQARREEDLEQLHNSMFG